MATLQLQQKLLFELRRRMRGVAVGVGADAGAATAAGHRLVGGLDIDIDMNQDMQLPGPLLFSVRLPGLWVGWQCAAQFK